ncbi:hypothetical protein IJ182_01840 [bacterium]|nr:hypothetical protein [bacterium]
MNIGWLSIYATVFILVFSSKKLKNFKWSVSCSYDILKADDKGGSENNIKYGMEILDGIFTHLALVKNPRYERANIVFNSKTVFVNQIPFEQEFLKTFCEALTEVLEEQRLGE